MATTRNNVHTEPITALSQGEGAPPDSRSIMDDINASRAADGLVPLFGPASPVDLEAFARAQTEFIQAQIRFHSPRMPGDQVFLEELVAFSRAQTELIKAQYRIMHQTGVL
jgi:hypothetical protein